MNHSADRPNRTFQPLADPLEDRVVLSPAPPAPMAPTPPLPAPLVAPPAGAQSADPHVRGELGAASIGPAPAVSLADRADAGGAPIGHAYAAGYGSSSGGSNTSASVIGTYASSTYNLEYGFGPTTNNPLPTGPYLPSNSPSFTLTGTTTGHGGGSGSGSGMELLASAGPNGGFLVPGPPPATAGAQAGPAPGGQPQPGATAGQGLAVSGGFLVPGPPPTAVALPQAGPAAGAQAGPRLSGSGGPDGGPIPAGTAASKDPAASVGARSALAHGEATPGGIARAQAPAGPEGNYQTWQQEVAAYDSYAASVKSDIHNYNGESSTYNNGESSTYNQSLASFWAAVRSFNSTYSIKAEPGIDFDLVNGKQVPKFVIKFKNILGGWSPQARSAAANLDRQAANVFSEYQALDAHYRTVVQEYQAVKAWAASIEARYPWVHPKF